MPGTLRCLRAAFGTLVSAEACGSLRYTCQAALLRDTLQAETLVMSTSSCCKLWLRKASVLQAGRQRDSLLVA
jgi:hypothetical protein